MKPLNDSLHASTSQTPVIGRELLDLITDLPDSAIDEFREKVKPEMRKGFDAEPDDTKIVLAALYRIGFEKLVILLQEKNGVCLLGVHDLRNRLTFIFGAVPEIEERWKNRK